MTPAWAAYRRSLTEVASPASRRGVLAGVAIALARAMPVPTEPTALLTLAAAAAAAEPDPAAAALEVPSGLARPDLLGWVLEALLDPADRHADGAYYTPLAIADGLVAEARRGADRLGTNLRVCDPAVGGGAFLLAAARSLHASGIDVGDIVTECLFGVDLDELAVAVTADSVSLWAASTGTAAAVPAGHLVVGDFLDPRLTLGVDGFDGFDLVVGNPPFQGQLARQTARDRAGAEAAAAWLGPAVHGYADTAALFLVAGARRCRPGGRVALLQPMSFLGAAHAGPARAELLDRARLAGLWVAGSRVFAASVNVCAPVLEVGVEPRSGVGTRLTTGPDFALTDEVPDAAAAPTGQASWGPLAARTAGVPAVEVESTPPARLADVASATAGFRRQFYGLAPSVREGGGPPLVTCGLVDPVRCRWGETTTRFAGRRWERPAVDLEALHESDPTLAAWVTARLVPKVVVATQTRVIEAAVDVDGEWVPSVPLISVEPHPDRLWEVAAALLAPATSALALLGAWGTGLAVDTVRLSATQLLDLPLPTDAAPWRSAAERLEEVAPKEPGAWLAVAPAFGAEMNAAYGLAPDHPSLAWWLERLPDRR